MKIFLSIILAFARFVYAETLDEHMSKMAKVVEKDGRCVFAAADLPTGKYATDDHWYPREVICVGDVKIGTGMNERSGCAAFNMDVYNLSTTLIGQGTGTTALLEGKKCEDVFEKLMAMDLPVFGQTVGHSFVTSVTEWSKPVIVYTKKTGFLSSTSPYQQWFDRERAKYLAGHGTKAKSDLGAKRSVATDNN